MIGVVKWHGWSKVPTVVGVIGVAVGLVYAGQTLVATRKQSEATEAQVRLADQGQQSERLSRAVEQLSSDKIDIRLGAIHSLEHLANDAERFRPAITSVLVTFANQHVPTKPCPPNQVKPVVDIQAAMTVWRRAAWLRENLYRGGGPGIDMPSACLSGAILTKAPLNNARLADTGLRDVDFVSAELRSANLRGSDLAGAKLSNADLSEANIASSNITRADLTGVRLSAAKLTKANLGFANLSYADLSKADFTGASLRGANLTGANLTGTVFDGADLTDAIGVR
ncbi:pentapeptide repeat-containing protein [Lentzea indica]|uniref:pentapeptide repeat-containing protein n=1 Tax=Lentzea indica TaxID=2604800 RepID=UPI00143CA8F1|nr:pentapeptide repeat-containing protein [Lentzea indica]